MAQTTLNNILQHVEDLQKWNDQPTPLREKTQETRYKLQRETEDLIRKIYPEINKLSLNERVESRNSIIKWASTKKFRNPKIDVYLGSLLSAFKAQPQAGSQEDEELSIPKTGTQSSGFIKEYDYYEDDNSRNKAPVRRVYSNVGDYSFGGSSFFYGDSSEDIFILHEDKENDDEDDDDTGEYEFGGSSFYHPESEFTFK